PTPLLLVAGVVLGSAGIVLMSVGALFSVSGSDESGTLGISRLAYAMSIDGLFPRIFSRLHPKYGTPYFGLIIQGLIAFVLSIHGGLADLISFAVFNLAFAFLLTCFAFVILEKRDSPLPGQRVLPWVGIAICLYLIYSTTIFDKVAGSLIILIGVPIYLFFSPKQDIRHLKEMFLSEEAIFMRTLEKKERLLGNFVDLIYQIYRKMRVRR
ncbi:MAG: APC family permease, partial [Methanoregulaceae archaeon]|nr:APC family permease [Methanoregulaceae archaeon]